MQVRRRSGKGIVYSRLDVKKWVEALPSASAVRPGCCSGCGAGSCPHGGKVVLVGHGTRERQIRGPRQPGAVPEVQVIRVRRYRCRRCGAITTVLPRGLVARRYYSGSAIGLALLLLGVRVQPVSVVRKAVCAWQATFGPEHWTTLEKWLEAIEDGRLYRQVRPWPPGFGLRQKAERVAMTLVALAPAGMVGCGLEEEVFVGGGLAA